MIAINDMLTKGYMSKFTYFMRTIDGFHKFRAPIDEVLNDHFIPTLFGSDFQLPELSVGIEDK